MKKYSPSINKNNQIREEFVKEFNSVLYNAEKGKVHPHINKDELKPILNSLRENLDDLSATLGTGEEDILNIAEESKKALKVLKEKLDQELISQIEAAADDLAYSLETWRDILNGEVELVGDAEQVAKVTWSKKKLEQRLVELNEIKKDFINNEKRLEKEIIQLEKDGLELDNLIEKEDNERMINELYRKIKTNVSKKDALNVRRSNYSACFNLLDLIYINAREIVAASNYSYVDYVKAKTYLNISKLKEVISEPDKAVSILNRMQKDLNSILKNTEMIDGGILGINNNTVVVDDEALRYKEELMKKRRDKKALEELDATAEEVKTEEKNEIKGEN